MSAAQPQVKREVILYADRDAVWEALTEPELLEQWLADEAEVELCEGGEIALRWQSGEERRGNFDEIVPTERLRIRWHRESHGESQVEFVLADAAAGTRLVVFESAVTSLPVGSANARWNDALFGLEVLMLGRGAMAFAGA